VGASKHAVGRLPAVGRRETRAELGGDLVSKNEIPEEVRKLIAEHIVSVEQLEVLLLLRSRPQEDWGPERVSEAIRTSSRSAEKRLANLAARDFITRTSDEPSYRYSTTGKRDQAVALLAETYAEKRYTVIELIFSKPIENLRVYSDAFLFRKEPSDG
jgi:hypothetical protein